MERKVPQRDLQGRSSHEKCAMVCSSTCGPANPNTTQTTDIVPRDPRSLASRASFPTALALEAVRCRSWRRRAGRPKHKHERGKWANVCGGRASFLRLRASWNLGVLGRKSGDPTVPGAASCIIILRSALAWNRDSGLGTWTWTWDWTGEPRHCTNADAPALNRRCIDADRYIHGTGPLLPSRV